MLSTDMATMENLWLSYSKGKFGYSVQKDLWRKTKGDFENFCRRIGWTTMDAEVRTTTNCRENENGKTCRDRRNPAILPQQ